MRRKISTSQNASLDKVSKKLFLTSESDSWLLRSISFLKSTKNGSQLPHNYFYVSSVALIYRKSFLRFYGTLYIQMMCSKNRTKHFTSHNTSLADFKNLMLRRIQESDSLVKKSFFETLSRLAFWLVEIFLRMI